MPRPSRLADFDNLPAAALINRADLCEMFSVSTQTARDWEDRGWLRPIRFSPKSPWVRYRADEIRALLDRFSHERPSANSRGPTFGRKRAKLRQSTELPPPPSASSPSSSRPRFRLPTEE